MRQRAGELADLLALHGRVAVGLLAQPLAGVRRLVVRLGAHGAARVLFIEKNGRALDVLRDVSFFVRNLLNQRPPVDLRAIDESGGGITPQSLADVQRRTLRLALEYKFY